MKKLVLMGFMCSGFITFSQISAPGIAKNGSAAWCAVGIQKKVFKNQSISAYVGIGRVSDSKNYNPFQVHSIHVLNTEFKQNLLSNWNLGVGISHRVQHLDVTPGELSTRQEFRLAAQISKKWQVKRVDFSISTKEEFRLFFDKCFHHWEEPTQWRTRVKAKVGVAMDENKRHKLILTSEELFSISKTSTLHHSWGRFHYGDTRVCLYYSYSPKKASLTIDLGYMSDFISYSSNRHQVDYVMVDFIVKLRNKKE